MKLEAWTFGDAVPAPTVHVRQGDRVNFVMTNRSKDGAAISPPGVFMYHCGTPMLLLHMCMGMYGAVVVDPTGGWPGYAKAGETVRLFALNAGPWSAR